MKHAPLLATAGALAVLNYATGAHAEDLILNIGGATVTLAPGEAASLSAGVTVQRVSGPVPEYGNLEVRNPSPPAAKVSLAAPPAARPAPAKASAAASETPSAADGGAALIRAATADKPPVAKPPAGGAKGVAGPPDPDPNAPATSKQVQDVAAKVDKVQSTVQTQQQKSPQGFCGLLGFSCGVGLTYAHPFGSERVDSVTAVQQSGSAQVYLQAKTSQNDNIAILGELHHFFLWDRKADVQGALYPDTSKDDGKSTGTTYSGAKDATNVPEYVRADLTNFRVHLQQKGDYVDGRNRPDDEKLGHLVAHDFGAILACGPFAFWPAFDAGCGPVAVAAVSTDGKSVTQFGVGWAGGVSTIGGADGTGFNLGIGMLFDPGEQILDSRIVNPNTRIVLPAYEGTVLANPNSALVKRPTHSVFIMVSKTLG